MAEIALFNRRRQPCPWPVIACPDDCGGRFRAHGWPRHFPNWPCRSVVSAGLHMRQAVVEVGKNVETGQDEVAVRQLLIVLARYALDDGGHGRCG
jgi:hypothetical protein